MIRLIIHSPLHPFTSPGALRLTLGLGVVVPVIHAIYVLKSEALSGGGRRNGNVILYMEMAHFCR